MKLLVTAGPTREPIDPVRFIGNRSSGRFGLALARAARDRGHDVTLLLGPGPAEAEIPEGCARERFESASDLEALIAHHFPACDVLLMAAAVADRRPAQRYARKLAREGGELETLSLEPTPDLVARAAAGRAPGQRVVAFALEAADELQRRAERKLARKGVDALWANPLPAMEGETMEGLWLTAAGRPERLAPTEKPAAAAWLIERVERLAAR